MRSSSKARGSSDSIKISLLQHCYNRSCSESWQTAFPNDPERTPQQFSSWPKRFIRCSRPHIAPPEHR